MNLIEALKAFLDVCFGGGECTHPRVNLLDAPTYCTDCGYLVKIEWVLLHCRRCNARRVPHRTFLGHIRPVQQYCRHCGYDDYRICKKPRIEAYELMYALCNKSTAYNEEPNTEPYIRSPFHTSTVVMENGDVFEAEVIRKSEYRGTRSAFKSSAFEWENGQGVSSKQYGSRGTTRHSATNSAPIVPYDKMRYAGGDA